MTRDPFARFQRNRAISNEIRSAALWLGIPGAIYLGMLLVLSGHGWGWW